ncbi:hypothetical protein PHLGIDRAFT_17319 [Phlebiopsis gigantea 11061_1 CR5-6]|uniref:Uncharacterized protein n=1 Tax=Phlebiopsis gigantea (strain 11061_1 CR5-6) TaxID=745531 RepID=A0A0C3N9V3_PHLG1|nr:hypothetical protein PHLGIDRAFT_17319 [Phlebiopsis gigantea 11061_1 CR5-6]
MPLQLRTTTLTAAETSDGIRIYTKDVDGFARELCNSTTTNTLAEGVKANNKEVTSQTAGWFTGELAFPCSIDSALCSFAWASWSQSVFYQDATDVLRERRHLNSWETTNFVQQGAMRGTNIAAVHSSGAAQIVLFYQDKDGYIRYRTAKNLVWNKDSVPLVKAALGTGIGATAWNNLGEIRLYYQDEGNVVREYRGNFDGKWSLTAFNKKYTHSIGDITAVSWSSGQATEIRRVQFASSVWKVLIWCRLYIQDETNNITELCNGGNDWYIEALQAMADTYKALLAQIYAQSKDIDAGSQAKQFAAGLLEIIKLAMSAAYLKQLLTLKEDDLINTMVEVAQCRY